MFLSVTAGWGACFVFLRCGRACVIGAWRVARCGAVSWLDVRMACLRRRLWTGGRPACGGSRTDLGTGMYILYAASRRTRGQIGVVIATHGDHREPKHTQQSGISVPHSNLL